MGFSIEFAEESRVYEARIKVIGVGGSGGNAINTMIHFGLEGVEFITVNTDAQALGSNIAAEKIAIGQSVTRGLGAGADPERGRKAALEDVNRLKDVVQGADMVFVTAGMGGGTGTGAAPVIAQLAREAGALTVGVVTKPFAFEGKQRMRRAEQGLQSLTEHVDTLITIPNEKLMALADDDLTFMEAFRKADEVLYQAVKGISDLITLNGIINVDFADVRTVMNGMGRALMGTGCAKGEGRARLAAEQAIHSPLLDEISVEGATGVLINIVGGPDMKMKEIQEAASLVQEQAHEDANVIFGASVDESMADTLKVTVIATGFHQIGVEVPVEAARDSRRPQASVVRERLPEPVSRAPMRAELREPVPAMASRRPAQQQPAMSSSMRETPAYRSEPSSLRDGQMTLPVRERITFPSVSDTDWDTPAFQRRQSG